MATTTIQVDRALKERLDAMKLHPRESYGEVLERILEDLRELNERTKREIERAVRATQAGKSKAHDEVRAEMGL